jgi:hypothetical protein
MGGIIKSKVRLCNKKGEFGTLQRCQWSPALVGPHAHNSGLAPLYGAAGVRLIPLVEH